jgi:uncharacterized phage protein gp47/JayE
MAFTRPTLPQLLDRIQADIESRLPGTDPRLRQSLLGILARAHAGTAHGLYGVLDYLARQLLPSTCTDEEIFALHAGWWDVPRNAAAQAKGNVTFTGTNGSVIPAGTTLQRSDGTQYTTDAEATIASGSATAAVTAVDGGQATNATAGQKLTLVSPIAGVQSSATVADGGLVGGSDIETLDAWRARLSQRVQNRPQGGALADYETWALEVEGVTRVWVMPLWLGLGTVGVFFTRDDDASPIPDAGEVAAVQVYIDARRPVTAAVTVYAPTAVPVDMTISLNPSNATVQAAVSAELADLFRRQNVEDGAGSGTVLLTHIREAISRAAGENNHAIDLVADVTLSPGEIATLGTITYQAL